MEYNDISFARHLAGLASLHSLRKPVADPDTSGSLSKPASSPSTPTITTPLKLVVSSESPDSNLLSPTENIPLEGKALFRDFDMDRKEKSSVINRIEILENQVTDLHQKFDQLDHKFDLLLSMLTPLITTRSVVCNPSLATEITPSPLVQDSQANNLPPAPITVTSDISVLKPEMHTSTKPTVPKAWTGTTSQLIKAPPDSKPIKPSASTPYRRSQSYAPPTKASDNPIDPKMRAYKSRCGLLTISAVLQMANHAYHSQHANY